MHWRRKWQPTPVFLPGESQGWGRLVGCCLWGRTESDMTEVTWHSISCINGSGHMTCSGLEAPPSCTRRCAPLWPSSLWSRRYLGDGWVTPDERSISGETEDVLPGGRATETSIVMGSGHDGGGDRVCRSPRGSGPTQNCCNLRVRRPPVRVQIPRQAEA